MTQLLMRLLAIDTATEACSVALWHDGQVVERFEVVDRSHTARLLPMVHALLAETGTAPAQLDGLACGIGPGSFAGVRIGVGFVKGLALALERPAVGVSSLDMLAQRALAPGVPRVLCAINARMGEVYFAAYGRDVDGRLEVLIAPRVGKAAEMPKVPAGEWLAVGTGFGSDGPALRLATGASIVAERAQELPHTADAIVLALPQFEQGIAPGADELGPLYLRNKVALTLLEQAGRKNSRT
ncbi:MAG TPA: tRNA (adenosine(37)-N6)-threonylcarbamoyltransferase complex dimerization subunit type 1 TsaB [Solimonas sp.]|nr:tRNA (adenosine(37)-N6)-threonylcarbamoyltransferase complex dimerization subunit type 1 TsaB [Solimonas sp.]